MKVITCSGMLCHSDYTSTVDAERLKQHNSFLQKRKKKKTFFQMSNCLLSQCLPPSWNHKKLFSAVLVISLVGDFTVGSIKTTSSNRELTSFSLIFLSTSSAMPSNCRLFAKLVSLPAHVDRILPWDHEQVSMGEDCDSCSSARVSVSSVWVLRLSPAGGSSLTGAAFSKTL